MSRETGRNSPRRRKSLSSANTDAVQQLPWTNLHYPYPPLEPLSDDELETVHDASMVVLEQYGIEVLSEKVQRRIQQIGARVDKSEGVVRVDRETVLDLVSKAPPSFL